MKKFEKDLNKLFDYQKFDGNPKLSQAIKDANLNDALLNDLELSKVAGAGEDNLITFQSNEKIYSDRLHISSYVVKNGGTYKSTDFLLCDAYNKKTLVKANLNMTAGALESYRNDYN